MGDVQTWRDFASVDDVRELADVTSTASVALQSQYSASPRFTQLGELFQSSLDSTETLSDLQKMVADMETARGGFLDWWGDRVGVKRYINVKGVPQRFDDDYYRFLLFYRAQCNIANSTVATMNKMLTSLTSTKVFVSDYLDMTLASVVVIGNISEMQANVLATDGILNRPAGVQTNFLIIYPDESIFGFEGSELLPFDLGVFNPGRTIEPGDVETVNSTDRG